MHEIGRQCIPDYIYKQLQLVPAQNASAIVIDLRVIRSNYHRIKAVLAKSNVNKCLCATVLKANAYGLGAVQVAQTLVSDGCQDFFVADIVEGIALRNVATKDSRIYVLCGLLPQTEEAFLEHNLIPTLIDKSQVERWYNYAKACDRRLPAILHFDTGMTRTGLSWQDALWYANRPDVRSALDIRYIMSHLACSDDEHNPNNLKQLVRFRRFKRIFSDIPATFSNSKGILHGPEYHFDMVRVGTFLFGLTTRLDKFKPTLQPVSIYAKILNTNHAKPGCPVGYGASYVCKRFSRIATIGIGYADGIPRALGSSNGEGGDVIIAGYRTKIVGRISMDLVTVDVTDIPEDLIYPGQWSTICSPELSAEEIAGKIGTISLEFLCSLGNRPYRIYLN
ncbi:MAG: alanine racemase [Holosporales bacterium]|jgi:alanine racemase|nr:alanine racemase [Holosporales bacterium]